MKFCLKLVVIQVKFFIVTTVECGEDRIQRQVHSVILTGWISSNMKYLLYPPPRFTVGGKSPIDWGEKTFKRFQILFESWMEYDIHAILNQTKAGKLINVFVSTHLFVPYVYLCS